MTPNLHALLTTTRALISTCGTPVSLPFPHTAEESGAGKQILLEKGAYKDMDVCIMYVL